MVWIIMAAAFWGFFHSFNASHSVKEFWLRAMGDGFMKYYRLAYNVIAVLTFLPILILLLLLPDRILYHVSAPWSYLMIAGQVFFALLLLAAVFQFGILYFIGLRQVAERPSDRKLVTTGLYGFVRHPFYTFFLLFLWLTPFMTVNLLVVYLALTIYIQIGIYFEERKLIREFGDQYVEYRASTPALFPAPKFMRNIWVLRFVLKPESSDKV
ncbi:MAG TPA: isoprenylcysteine carboxylmethyltransferase family protein [Anaerolineales bacterium]|nr:isoprenylcysteine carboxylmethyltransferase family protein [Anaerolineales bacterium]